MELDQINYSEYWLAADPYGNLLAVKRDSTFVRWIKHLINVLSCGCASLYDHIQIDHVSKAVFVQFENAATHEEKKKLLTVVEHLLDLKRPIKTYRVALMELHRQMESSLHTPKKQP